MGAGRRPLKVTLVEFSPAGGLFQFAYQLAVAIGAQGHDVELLTGSDPEFPTRDEVRVVSELPTWRPHAGAESRSAIRRLRRIGRATRLIAAWARTIAHLRRRRPDLVLWAEWRFPLDAWGARLARRAAPRATMMDLAHTPVPFSEQRRDGSLYKEGRFLLAALRRAYAEMDAVLVLGPRARQELVEHFPGVGPVHVIPHGDESLLVSGEGVPSAGDTPPTVLLFGTLARYKGAGRLLDLWPDVQSRVPEARLVIAGATVDVDPGELRRAARSAGGVDLRLGYVAAAEVPRLFAEARLLVAPYEIANTSGVVRLAHTFARPVVVTDVGDLASAVEDGATGLVVPPRSRQDLVDAIVRLLEDPAECERQGAVGRERLEQTSAWPPIAERVLAIHDEVRRG
jgi:glycosyltransferase involved in cell wall biosynthesis